MKRRSIVTGLMSLSCPYLMRLLAVVCFLTMTGRNHAQTATDSMANDFHGMVARNFSRYRTVNMYWEMNGAHDYTITANGKEVAKGRKRDLHTIRFSTMVPILKQRRFSLYANVQYAGYVFDCSENLAAIFSEDSYNRYLGGFTASYITTLFKRPLILGTDIFADGWDGDWGMLQGRIVAALVLARNRQTAFSLGLAGMTLGRMPVLPVISYWHRFSSPHWSIDVTLPSQLYLRYQWGNQRVSTGASMGSDNFYLGVNLPGIPSVCYYSEAVMKPEMLYEYIINKHFYLSAHIGMNVVMSGALYTKSRKEPGMDIELKRSATPFFNVGVSYSLFK